MRLKFLRLFFLALSLLVISGNLHAKEIELAKGVGKSQLLAKLDNLNVPNVKNWINRLDDASDAALLKKVDDLAMSDPAKLSKLNDLYDPNKFSLPSGLNPPSTHNGISFDKNGFPDFVSKAPQPAKDFSYVANDLIGNTTSTDFTKATNWLIEKFPNRNIVKNGNRVEIDGVMHTWHHHQDGKTLIPVPSSIHNSVSHTGGNATIQRGLQGFFESPF
jgi:hypothetical protein